MSRTLYLSIPPRQGTALFPKRRPCAGRRQIHKLPRMAGRGLRGGHERMDDWQRLGALAREYSGHAVAVVLVLLAGLLGDRFLVVPVRRLLERSRLDPSLGSFLASSARTLLLAAVFLAVLQQLGVQTA